MIDLTFFHKSLYLDRPLVQQAVEQAGQDPQRMRRAGELIRSEARRSMRYVKKPTTNAPPGFPPRARLPRRPNLRSIEYFWSPSLRMMVVGSAVFPGSRAQIQNVPEVHEFGGPIRLPREISIYKRPRGLKGSGRRASRKQLRALKKKRQEERAQRELLHQIAKDRGLTRTVWRTYRYPRRPYMWPATVRIIDRLPKIWRRSIRFNLQPGRDTAPVQAPGFRVVSRAA